MSNEYTDYHSWQNRYQRACSAFCCAERNRRDHPCSKRARRQYSRARRRIRSLMREQQS